MNFNQLFILQIKKMIFLIVSLACINICCGFRLQGVWSVTQIKGYPIIRQTASMQIQDFVFRDTQVQQRMLFSGCQNYRYIVQVIQNGIFIKYSTYQLQKVGQQSNQTQSCSADTLSMHSAVRRNLQQVFTFKLFGNILVFLDPNNNIVLQFKRNQSNNIRNLRGTWSLYRVNSVQTSQTVQVADTQISFCQGKLTVGYILDQKYGIKTRLISNQGCQQKQLEKTVLSSSFYRRIGTSVQIYNSDIEIILQLKFIDEIDLQQIEKQRLAAIQNAKKAQSRNKLVQAQALPQSASQGQITVKNQMQLSNTTQDLIGRWQPLSVFGINLIASPVFLIFTRNLISYNGGCNTFQFQYVAYQSNQSLDIGQNRSSSNKCPTDDDGLFISALVRIYKYSLTMRGNQLNLKITDSAGVIVYELTRTLQANSNNQVQNVGPAISVNDPLQPGRYVFLILSRRDLPRRFSTISKAKITYEGCNTIEHTYNIMGSWQISIQGNITSKKTCSINNDQIFFNAFNSVSSFQKGQEAGSYILKNANNVDIINLSLF